MEGEKQERVKRRDVWRYADKKRKRERWLRKERRDYGLRKREALLVLGPVAWNNIIPDFDGHCFLSS